MRKLEQQENKNKRNFADFRRKLKASPRGGRTPLGEGAHSKWGYRLNNAVRDLIKFFATGALYTYEAKSENKRVQNQTNTVKSNK